MSLAPFGLSRLAGFNETSKTDSTTTAYETGPGPQSTSLPLLCLFSFFTGAGSCSAFTASIKAAALNYPDSRGTATAFPLAAFGLSALFFAVVALALPHDTYSFLILLATGTVVLPVLAFPFLSVHAVAGGGYEVVSQGARRRKSSLDESSALNSPSVVLSRSASPPSYVSRTASADDEDPQSPFLDDDATPDELARSQYSEQLVREASTSDEDLDIRGWALTKLRRFWLIFTLLGLLTGIGLMTINNIGNVTLALWRNHLAVSPDGEGEGDPSPDVGEVEKFIARTQSMHVSLLSFFSFSGRLLSGIGSDALLKRFGSRRGSRFWCLVASSLLFILAQYISITLTNPHLLVLISGTTGLAYGMLFGVYPSIVAHAFGVQGLSQNWGTMTLAPVISGNVFNLLYGRIYDSHSVLDEETRERVCALGRGCYESAYVVTLVAAVGALGLACWAVWRDWSGRGLDKEGQQGVNGDEEVVRRRRRRRESA